MQTIPTFDWVNSRNMAARPSSSMSLSVFIATFRIWIGSSWALWTTKQIRHFIPRYTATQVNDQTVTITGLLSSPCCPLRRTGQDCLPLGRLDLEEESQRSSSTRLLCSYKKKGKKKSYMPLITPMTLSPCENKTYSSEDLFYTKDWPGELLEGAERYHGSHTLTRGCKRCVKQNIAHAGYMHHAVVVQVGWEWHPKVLKGRVLLEESTTPLDWVYKDVPIHL